MTHIMAAREISSGGILMLGTPKKLAKENRRMDVTTHIFLLVSWSQDPAWGMGTHLSIILEIKEALRAVV